MAWSHCRFWAFIISPRIKVLVAARGCLQWLCYKKEIFGYGGCLLWSRQVRLWRVFCTQLVGSHLGRGQWCIVGRFNSRFNLEIWFRSRGWFYQLFLKNWETELSPLQAQEEYWSSLIKDTLGWPEIYSLPHCATSDTCKDAWISNWYLVTNAFFVSNWCCASSSVFFVWKRKTNPSNISLLIYCNYAK